MMKGTIIGSGAHLIVRWAPSHRIEKGSDKQHTNLLQALCMACLMEETVSRYGR